MIDDARQKVDPRAKGIREKSFAACPGDHCEHCDAREICGSRKG